MNTSKDEGLGDSVEDVFIAPSVAQAAAERVLANPASSSEAQAEALTTLGRTAYYDNRIDDAVSLLERALILATTAKTRVDAALILGPALSKVGRTSDALGVLDLDDAGLTVEQLGTVHNQRGIIHAESGQLPEALASFEIALNNQRKSGDIAKAGRALINMGAAASEMGDLERAEELYEEGWHLTVETGQDVATATIEGNLGYVASRKGDFGAAREWYRRGRASFAALGDVDLLVAVLEADYATTLLDVGLDVDALEAAEYARASAAAGSNRMLDLQALLLLGETQNRLGHFGEAEATLQSARSSASELGLRPWELRADYLLNNVRTTMSNDIQPPETTDILAVATGLRDAAWFREALRTVVRGATTAFQRGDHVAARQLLDWSSTTGDSHVDPIDLSLAAALEALLADDLPTFGRAIDQGFDELARLRTLVGSAELEARLGHRARELLTLALRVPLSKGDATGVIVAREKGERRTSSVAASTGAHRLRAELRDARVAQQEARLNGSDVGVVDARVAKLEADLYSTLSRAAEPNIAPDPSILPPELADHVAVRYVENTGSLWAIRLDDEATLFELGPVSPIQSAARAQRAALRRMATGGEVSQITTAAAKLATLLVEPLELPPDRPVIIVPDRAVTAVSWAGLPPLVDRSFGLTPTLSALAQGPRAVSVSSVGVVGTPDLALAKAEVERLGAIWQQANPTTLPTATSADAMSLFETHELVHVAAHGTFRPDNPFFSTLDFTDGSITLLDLEQLTAVPSAMVLGACSTAAAETIGMELVGTTSALISLGVRVVVAPSVIVDDAAAHRFVLDLHAMLVEGVPVMDAMASARARAIARNTPADVAAGMSFHVHGSRAMAKPIQVSCI